MKSYVNSMIATQPVCSGHSGNNEYTKVLRLGPADTDVPAIVFSRCCINTDYVVIDKIAEANVEWDNERNSTNITTYGSSSWTLFEGKNFEGKYECFASSGVIRYSTLNSLDMMSVGSVIRSCTFSKEYLNQLRDEVLK